MHLLDGHLFFNGSFLVVVVKSLSKTESNFICCFTALFVAFQFQYGRKEERQDWTWQCL